MTLRQAAHAYIVFFGYVTGIMFVIGGVLIGSVPSIPYLGSIGDFASLIAIILFIIGFGQLGTITAALLIKEERPRRTITLDDIEK